MPTSSAQSSTSLMWKKRETVLAVFFFFNDTATTEIYTLSLHDALPILRRRRSHRAAGRQASPDPHKRGRSEEHTSELQSQSNLVCRLLLEKNDKKPDQPEPHDLCFGVRVVEARFRVA